MVKVFVPGVYPGVTTMGVSSSAGQARPRPARHSVRFTFISMVAVPTVCMVLLWGLAVGIVLATSLAGHGALSQNHQDLVGIVLIVAAGLVVVIAALVLTGSFARRLSHDITGLAVTARRLADEQLPQLPERRRAGDQTAQADVQPGQANGAALDPGARTTEIADAVAAIASLQRTAVSAADAEAGLRDGLRQVFVSLGRRNQSLLQRQLRLIDTLEQKASNPSALADLFTLDHLTTRMRRHAESLTILSGAAPGRTWTDPVPVIDVIRAAVAEIEDYKRVTVFTRSEDAIMGPVVADMIHMLAELVENATLFSPSTSRVEVRAERVANGFAIEIDDRGLGITPDQLADINQQLAEPPDFDLANADRLGLFVAGRLAARHGIRVSLRPSPFGGTTAIVLMPNSIVVAPAEPDVPLPPVAARLDLQPAEALALTAGQGPAAATGPATTPGHATAATPAERSLLVPQRPDAAPDAAARASQPAPGTYRGLPRRTRQASLSPHLRNSPAADDRPAQTGAAAAQASSREPEQARDLAASLQSGWLRGRGAEVPDAEPMSDTQAVRRRDSEAPDGEEA
jgi:signal transduction histidine kinase